MEESKFTKTASNIMLFHLSIQSILYIDPFFWNTYMLSVLISYKFIFGERLRVSILPEETAAASDWITNLQISSSASELHQAAWGA